MSEATHRHTEAHRLAGLYLDAKRRHHGRFPDRVSRLSAGYDDWEASYEVVSEAWTRYRVALLKLDEDDRGAATEIIDHVNRELRKIEAGETAGVTEGSQ